MPDSHASLGDRLEQLLQVEKFPPPADFAARAQVSDPAVYEQAAADPVAWWATQARERLHWDTPFSSVLDDSNPPFYTWFADGAINVSYNCLDRHVLAGRGDRVAFYWRGEEGEERELTYAELLGDVQRLANALKAQGVRKGDVVGIYLPMIPEVVVAMLACARIGAPHTVVFGGFLLHRADRHPGLHEVGRGIPGQAQPVVAAATRHRRRADQPQGLAVV